MTTKEDEVIEVECEALTYKEEFFLEWGLESLKGTAPAINDALQRIVVLDTALIGGGFVAAKGDVLPFWGAVLTLLVLVVSLVASLWGIYPRGRDVNLLDPDDIQANEYDAINRKARMLRIAFIAIAGAFLVAIASLVIRGPVPQTPMPPPSIPLSM